MWEIVVRVEMPMPEEQEDLYLTALKAMVDVGVEQVIGDGPVAVVVEEPLLM